MTRSFAQPFAISSLLVRAGIFRIVGTGAMISLVSVGCATTHVETRDECGARCSRKYEDCARNAIVPDSLHACGVEGDRCAAMCPLH